MIDAEQARSIAEGYLGRRRRRPLPFELVVHTVDEHEFCWVVIYNAREFVETGDRRHLLFGPGPLFINKATGALREGVSGVPSEQQLDGE